VGSFVDARKGDLVRPWILLAIALLILAGCSEASTPPEQPEKEGIEKVEKQPTQKADVTNTEPVEKEVTETAPEEQTEPQAESPKDVLASQYKHINVGNYGMAYDLFADQSQQLVSLQQYTAYFASNAPYEIKSYSFPDVHVQGDEASVVVDLAVSSSDGEEEYQVTQQLVREDGSWRVVMRDAQLASFTDVSTSSQSASASAPPEPEPAAEDYDATVTVSRVVDGDTIEISPAIDGVEDVRLIGIDTPETVDPEEEVEPYGPEASAFATEELAGRKVHLEFDEEKVDQYDRLLAYVYADSSMFNEDLLEEGYAQAYPYPPNTKYEGRFADAQADAMAAGIGIWGLTFNEQCQLADRGNGIGEGTPGCQSVTSATTSASASSPSASAGSSATAQPSGGAAAPISENDCPQSAPIKGNQSGLYHVPGGAYYDVTNPEECFATAADAEAAGYEASR
jgi:micrococcal nuclease